MRIKIRGWKYRFVAVSDPPTPYGVGLDSPDREYWIDLPSGEVYSRPLTPVYPDGSREEWVKVAEPELYALARFLREIRIDCYKSWHPREGVLLDCSDFGYSPDDPHPECEGCVLHARSRRW